MGINKASCVCFHYEKYLLKVF